MRILWVLMVFCLMGNGLWGQWSLSITHNFGKPKAKALNNKFVISKYLNSINASGKFQHKMFSIHAGLSFTLGGTITNLCFDCDDFIGTIHDKRLGSNFQSIGFTTGVGLFKKVKQIIFYLDFIGEVGYSKIILWENYLVNEPIASIAFIDIMRAAKVNLSLSIPIISTLHAFIGSQFAFRSISNYNLKSIEANFGIVYHLLNLQND